MKYEVEISESAEKSIEKVPKKDRLKIIEKIDALGQIPIPSGSIKLQGYKETLYRIRSGNYRIVYSIKKDICLVKLFLHFPELKKELWGGHLWSPSYYAGTAGNVSAETIQMYIERVEHIRGRR